MHASWFQDAFCVPSQINERVQGLVEAAEGGCILVEGEAGMGKSRLLEEIQRSDLKGNRDAITIFHSSANFDHRGQVTPEPPSAPRTSDEGYHINRR